ncbi:hypothetical protein [Mesorhizobium huakuii]|uniref:Uncharacterized protein n=1 Tax=Mesorhizobium huakuii TaxID=28104 RepID=A0A7G6SQW5_9HYPH|nr:hypothetical protein [Mesorhizobium huakuii]QND56897.1 hypothetical protein HB778_09950 [Mesorhizobium huakuii]
MEKPSFIEQFDRETEAALLRKLRSQKPHQRAIMADLSVKLVRVFAEHFQPNGKEKVVQ